MELKAHELRIGNLLENFLGEVFECNIETLNSLINGGNQFPPPKPIPLTDEWLLRFGFEVNDDLGDQIYYEIPNQKIGYGICFDHDDITFYKFYGNGGENVHTLIYDEEHLQSVHQLQNLYFSLTNNELKLK